MVNADNHYDYYLSGKNLLWQEVLFVYGELPINQL